MIFVECKPDYTLASKLASTLGREVEHSGNKSAVLNKLVRRKEFQNYENSLGIIDEDPRSHQPDIIREFVEEEGFPRCRMRLFHYAWLNNSVLVLCPRLEEWVIEAANETGIDMGDYDLPNGPEMLHQVINLNIDKFELLVDALKVRSLRVKELMRCIETLPCHPTY